MKVIKQVLRMQMGVVLLETKTRGDEPNAPARVSYSISSKRTPKIRCFDDLQVAESFSKEEKSQLLPQDLAFPRPPLCQDDRGRAECVPGKARVKGLDRIFRERPDRRRDHENRCQGGTQLLALHVAPRFCLVVAGGPVSRTKCRETRNSHGTP